MSGIPVKKRMIYLQIILFLLGSFTLLIQGAMESSGHLFSDHDHGNMDHTSMQMDVSAAPAQLDQHYHGKAEGSNTCCDDCNCANHNCSVDCSMFHFMDITMNSVAGAAAYSSKPTVSVPLLVGIYDFPDRPPPRLFLI